MSNCYYRFKLKGTNATPILTKLELYSMLSYINTADVSSAIRHLNGYKIKFSKESEATLARLDAATDSKPNLEVSQSASNDLEFTEKDIITACRLIEDHFLEFGPNSFPSLTDPAAFKLYVKKYELLKNPALSEEELDRAINYIISKWEVINKDGVMLHAFMPYGFSAALNEDDQLAFENAINNFNLEINGAKLKDRLTVPTDVFKERILQINSYINHNLKGLRKPGENNYRSGIRLSAELTHDLATVAKKVGIHIDRIYVDELGHVHVYNFKFSLSKSNEWHKCKRDKYEYEMAIIREVLVKHGIIAENDTESTFTNIPIQLVYDDANPNNPKIVDIKLENYIGKNYMINNASSPIIKKNKEINQFLKETAKTYNTLIILGANLLEADEFLKAINPEYNAKLQSELISAKAWIKANEHTGAISPRKDGKLGWHIILPTGKEFDIDELSSPIRNTELLELITVNINELGRELPVISSLILQSIKNAYALGKSNVEKGNGYLEHVQSFEGFGFTNSAAFLEQELNPYITTTIPGTTDLLWELIEDTDGLLSLLGIYMFKNTLTGLIDIFKASALKLNEYIPVPHDLLNLLGFHVMDMGGVTELKSCYGHMELMRVAAVLNAVVEKIPNAKFGNIEIVSPYYGGTAMRKDALFVVKEFTKIVRYLNNKKNGNFKNNFQSNLFLNPISSIIQTSLKLLRSGILDISQLQTASTDSAQIASIKVLMQEIESKLRANSPRDILLHKFDQNAETRTLVNIYELCISFICKKTGFYDPEVKYINSFKRIVLPLYANPDANVRQIGNLYSRELDKLALEFLSEFNPVRKYIDTFENSKGLTNIESRVMGSPTRLYEKMYRRDPQTNANLWQFVNPYDDSECAYYGLDENDRLFLKRAIFHFAKYRARAKGNKLPYSSCEDENFIREVNSDNSYLLVPLHHASSSSRHKHKVEEKCEELKQTIKKISTWDKFKSYVKDSMQSSNASRYIDGTPDENGIYNKDLKDILANRRTMYVSENPNSRALFLAQYPDTHWETNIAYLLADYTEQQLSYEHMQQVEFVGKNMLFQMYLLGEHEGDNTRKLLHESMEEIEKFMKLNIYDLSIMSDFGKRFTEFMLPAKRLMSNLYIAANLRSAFRDSFEGLWQNTMRTITHYETDLTTRSLMLGYALVFQHMFDSDRQLNIMSELCLRYRLSNTDSAKVSERAKSSKGGIFDPEYMGFSTLRGPDFLNRMTLFVARCMQDGVWDAFSIHNNELVYDCKKDARFKNFFYGAVGSEEYNKAKSAYFSAVREYNSEHSETLQIGFDIENGPLLPEPYSQNDVRKFKEFADGIYGAYDKSQKALYEHMALGQTLGVFSTWFNGHTAAWLREPGAYLPYFKTVDENGNPIIATSESGNEQWFDKDGRIIEKIGDNNFINPDTGESVSGEGAVPVIGKVPIQVLGILYTLKDSWKVLRDDGFSLVKFKENVLAYETNVENFRKLFGDLFMMFLYGLLFGFILTPMYKDHKKKKDCDNILADALVELLYKSSSTSFDGFFAPIAVMDYVRDDMKPSVFNTNFQLLTDMGKTLFGEKSWKAFMYGNAPIFRTFKDTAKMYDADAFKTIKEA